jgi:hypothetical protein
MQHASPIRLNLPSWVVDWVGAYPSRLSGGSLEKSLDPFHAAATSEASIFIEFDETLVVKRFCIRDISVVDQNIHNMCGKQIPVHALCNDFHQSRSILGSPD